MKSKLIYLIPIAIAAFTISKIDSEMIALKAIANTNVGTLFVTFPIILALTERFNEIFIVSKKCIKETNIYKTSITSFSIGIVLAIAGFRILETFMQVPNTAGIIQKTIFTFIDTILTAVVIAGGTDGWHQLVGLLQDVTKMKRKEFKSLESKEEE